MDIFDKLTIGFDQGIILAIIAINMTIIGLTSLAESKKVIGIDYGQFLIKRYKIGRKIRIYYLLILFAIINVLSLISMFLDYGLLNAINSIVLVISLTFAIYYFFSYILVENEMVKKQIDEQELTGMYYKSEDDKHFEVDCLVNIPNGYKTSKRLSSSVARHFDYDTELTVNDFRKCFGLKSPVYNYSKTSLKKLKNLKELANMEIVEPYPYRKDEHDIRDISHEFFQLFRNCKIQHKWSLDILKLCNRADVFDIGYNKIRLYNLTRMMTHVNTFGYGEGLFMYKYMEHLLIQIKLVLDYECFIEQENEVRHLLKVEKYFYEQLYTFMFKTVYEKKNIYYIRMTKKVLNEVLLGSIKGLTSLEKKYEILIKILLQYECDDNKQLINDLINEEVKKGRMKSSDVDLLKKNVENYREDKLELENSINLFA